MALKAVPLFGRAVQDVVKFDSRLKTFQFLPHDYIFFCFVGEKQSKVDRFFAWHVGDLVEDLIERSDSASRCDSNNPLDLLRESPWISSCNTYDGLSSWEVVEIAERSLEVNAIPYVQSFEVWGEFASIGKLDIHIWPVDFNENVEDILRKGRGYFLGKRTDGSVLSDDLFSLRSIVGLYSFNKAKVLPNAKFKGFVLEFELIEVAVIVERTLADYLSGS